MSGMTGLLRIALTLVLTGAALAPVQLAAQSAPDLYQQALRRERTEGDLVGAIRLYEQVVRTTDRTLAARALLRIGEAYEQLGRAEATAAYQRLVREFGDQAEPAAQARVRLAALTTFATPAAAPAGLTMRRVWHDPGVDVEGMPTPDGRYLTFVDWMTGDLAIRDLAAGQHRLLTRVGYPAYALFSSVSPDGQMVAFLWNTGEGLSEWQPQLRIVGIDGTGERVLIENASREINYITPTDWTPDGRRVLVALQKRAGNEIALVDVRSGAVQVVRAMDWRIPARMGLSPDGRWIAYDVPSEQGAIERDIFVLAADGSAEHRLTTHPANDLHPIWTPDGSLLFSSERGGSVGLWLVRMRDGRAAGEPELIKGDMTPGFYPMGFTPAGTLFYAQDTGGGDLYTVAFDASQARITGEPTKFVQLHQGFNTGAHFSSAGDLLAYMSRRNAVSIGHSARLVLHDRRTGVERILPVRGHRQFARPRISPDGRQVLLSARSPLQHETPVRVIDVETGATRTLAAPLGTPHGHAVWSNDGQSVYYFRDDSLSATDMRPRLIRHHVASGREEIVHHFDVGGAASTWSLSPDEGSIAYAGRERGSPGWRVRVAPLGGASQELVRIPAPAGAYRNAGTTWTPDGRHILYGEARDEQWPGDPMIRLYAVPASGGQPHDVGLERHELRHLSFTPDGALSFTAGPIVFNEVWAMEHPAFGSAPRRAAGSR
jgi:Tol biopolymer transport system component